MTLPSPPQFCWSAWRRVLLTAGVALGALLFAAGTASAHDVLVSSDPVADSVLAKAPATVTLVFDQQVQNIYAEMAITIGSQAPVEFTPTIDGAEVTADLSREPLAIPKSTAGIVPWKIGYRIVSADGHPVTGLVTFSVGTGRATAPTNSVAAVTHTPGSALWMWVLIAGAVVLVMLVAITVLLIRNRRSERVDPTESIRTESIQARASEPSAVNPPAQ